MSRHTCATTRPQPEPCPACQQAAEEAAEEQCTCGGDHTEDEHDAEAALDADADAYFDRY